MLIFFVKGEIFFCGCVIVVGGIKEKFIGVLRVGVKIVLLFV